MLLAGIGLFAYPAVSDYIFARNCSTATAHYDDSIARLGAEALERALREAVAYNENLEGNPVHDPFLVGTGMAMSDNYFEVLDQHGDGTMGYVSIPKISVKIPICHGTAEAILLKGVGHLEGSSMPIGGPGSHSVLTGHTGLANAKMFTDLRLLKEGDLFYLHILDQTLAYKIDQILTVLPEDIEQLRRQAGADYCTLVTCTPYGINTHRLLVRGVRTEYVPEAVQSPPAAAALERLRDWDMLIGLGVGFGILVCIIIFILIWRKKQEKEEQTLQHTPTQRSDNPWEAISIQTPGGRKTRRRRGRKYRPGRRIRSARFWWEDDGRG